MSEAAPAPEPAEVSAEDKAKATFAAARKVVKGVALEAVRFRALAAQGFATVDLIPDDADLNGATSFLRPSVTSTEEGFSTRTTLVFRLSGKLPGEVALKPYAVVRATLEAEYSLNADAPEFSEEELTDFALCYCPFHVWGYWREFVQSSLARLDLPHVTLPLFLINQALKLVRDDLDSSVHQREALPPN